ncbi:hypothetical protein PHYBLDRAFT_145573 [Phycomyces blakesleeanus NRRL 1555(-)]|uniref:Uncharacterized protein n=1 Tax=Phycomyces blakesleeanus (strain ATCC 8743b / DSM 1359 / FGSC 10004 / NBRC 33097 / NRRL 1555) TaxID=763407 RepID=A0A162PIH3_PHYB8|nr:hypothetical protein PHYBLDRAFT_145573 [Phycomyces blakesleeanus NRRL 1555(-)]OAD73167.1 hypothetical protein PHYBLDRAFT_145573 [Phycomyces blakesleeanus NRRL 1555(-)]|eukprot:XP_018291207.1 hypothetical protein PHYBLDRAFT_145573 [Phycomyces blakesleeanus NRRL 1555(-)]
MAKNDDQIYIHYGRPNSKDQNSNLGYSVFTIRLHNEKFVFLPVRQSKPAIMDPISVQCYSVLAVKGNEQEPVKFNAQGSDFHQVLQAEELGLDIHPDLQIYIFRWAVDYWLFFIRLLFLLSRATIKDPISIQYDSVFTAQVEEQGFLLHPRLQPFLLRSKRSMLSSTLKVSVHAENQGCTSKNRAKLFEVFLQSNSTVKIQITIKNHCLLAEKANNQDATLLLGCWLGGLFTIEANTQNSIVHAGLQSRLLIEILLFIWVHTDGQVSAIRRVHTKDQYFSLHPGSQTFKSRDKLPTLNHEPQYSKSESNDQASAFRQGLKISNPLIKSSVIIKFPLNIIKVLVNDQDPAINSTS